MASSEFYATSAQVIPTLLLVVAVERRYLFADWPRDEAVPAFVRYGFGFLAWVAVVGEFTCLRALFVGGSDVRAVATFAGLTSAASLALQPLVASILTAGITDSRRWRRLMLIGTGLACLAVLIGSWL